MKKLIIAVLGPTSSGKSDIAIKLARRFNGEIISVDSRQIYRGMNIGTGKVEADPHPLSSSPTCGRGWIKRERKTGESKIYSGGIPHYGIDLVSPKTEYNAAKFKKYADKIIVDILGRGKLPILCGGTGFWVKAIIDNIIYPEVKPDWKLRNKLRNKPVKELFIMLKEFDSERAKNVDSKNPVRLIRAIEVCKTLGKVPNSLPKKDSPYSFLQIGIDLPKEKLYENIEKRLKQRFERGMIEEVKKLHYQNKISWKRLESFGLGYKIIPAYLRGEAKNKDEVFEKVYLAEKNYAKRQMTWFSAQERIIWLSNYLEIKKIVKKFIKAI